MSSVDENANLPVENSPAKGKKLGSPVRNGSSDGRTDKNSGNQNANRQQAAYDEFVYRNQNKKTKKKKKKKKNKGKLNGEHNDATKSDALTANGASTDAADGIKNGTELVEEVQKTEKSENGSKFENTGRS